MNALREKYKKEVIQKLKKQFGFKNDLEVPALEKAVINVGLGKALKDDKFAETVANTLERISGQKPVKTRAKKSIAGFKIREGMAIGMKVTLRGTKMYDFIYKLINIALPRVRDFRGIELKSIDGNGNLCLGFKENIVFPEISSDEVEKIHGLEVAVHTTAQTSEQGFHLLKELGFPFKSL